VHQIQTYRVEQQIKVVVEVVLETLVVLASLDSIGKVEVEKA
jgi:hypothetical protein